MEWLPEKTHDVEVLFEMQLLTLEWQLYIIKNLTPSVKLLSTAKKRYTVQLFDLGKYYNREMVELLNKAKRS